ncbi:MAG TPA: MotA/TolQ/ExbB proton channel family protein [Candidatus Binatia bacterium]|nr:MotA/TolQ/ExbB proton channel family protein [Candidatus Binatia bacterium]
MRRLAPPGPLGRLGPLAPALATAATITVAAAATGLLHPLSLCITVGGALAVARATFPRERIRGAWRNLQAALDPAPDLEGLVVTLRDLSRVHRMEGARALERAAAAAPDGFLRRAILLGVESLDADGEELAQRLTGEARARLADIEAARQVLVTLGKLFPAFGLIGTLMGLALLMRHLSGADVTAIGPGLGIAVLTTLYGAVLSNVVALPLATRLQSHLAAESLRLEMIIEGAVLVQRLEYPSRVERVLRAYTGRPAGEGRRGRPVLLTERAA